MPRYLSRLKSYVRNKAAPEGSIAEGYIVEECLTFCSRYMHGVETIFTRSIRTVENSTGAVSYFTLGIRLDSVQRLEFCTSKIFSGVSCTVNGTCKCFFFFTLLFNTHTDQP